ncbi:MAG: TatD family hydrolase [Bacteroidales bacterium]|nr:TatD family hydrolase [Bacteroidales bacterium]
MEFIDTHTHISDEAFAGEEEAIISRALEAGVTRMIQADVDSSEREPMYKLVESHPECLSAMLGLYPGSVHSDWRDELDAMLLYKERKFCAVGEIGLDYHYGAEDAEYQKEALRVQFDLALEWGKPVNIHLREATEDFFTILDDYRGRGLRGNLHAFSGSYETFCRIQKYGDWFVGLGGVITFKNSGIGKAVPDIPLDRILLETDAPYLTPVPYRGKRNESSMIPIIASFIAERKGLSPEVVANQTTNNAKVLFGPF